MNKDKAPETATLPTSDLTTQKKQSEATAQVLRDHADLLKRLADK